VTQETPQGKKGGPPVPHTTTSFQGERKARKDIHFEIGPDYRKGVAKTEEKKRRKQKIDLP